MYPDQVNLPNLKRLIEEFVHEQHHPGSNARNIPNLPHFFERITIHTAVVATFHAPSDLSGIGGMKHEHWYAKGATKIAKHARALDQSVALWGSESAIRG